MFHIYILAFFYMLIFFILPTQIPFLLIETFKASGSFAGTIIAIAFLSNALGAISFAKIKGKYSYISIYIIGLAIIGIGFAGVGFVNHTYLFFLTSPILGFGGGLMMTNITAWMLSQTSAKKRVKTSGYFTSAIFLGQFSSPLIFHSLVTYLGVQDFFLAIGVTLLIIVFSYYLYMKLRSF